VCVVFLSTGFFFYRFGMDMPTVSPLTVRPARFGKKPRKFLTKFF